MADAASDPAVRMTGPATAPLTSVPPEFGPATRVAAGAGFKLIATGAGCTGAATEGPPVIIAPVADDTKSTDS